MLNHKSEQIPGVRTLHLTLGYIAAVLTQAEERDQSCKDSLGPEQNRLVSSHTEGALKLS